MPDIEGCYEAIESCELVDKALPETNKYGLWKSKTSSDFTLSMNLN